MSQKLDLYKEHADEYAAGAAPRFVQTRRAKYLTIVGEGDPGGKEFQDSVHPCFAALKKLGKPGSNAALKGLRALDLSSESEGLDSPSYRAGLLALVIRAVEGDGVGQYILRRERAAARDEAHQRMYDQLITPDPKLP